MTHAASVVTLPAPLLLLIDSRSTANRPPIVRAAADTLTRVASRAAE